MPTFLPIDLDPLPEDSPQRLAASARGAVFRGVADEPVTDAKTDAELAREYIGQGELSPKSIANTQKELYRFLTWCREEARKTFRHTEANSPMRANATLESIGGTAVYLCSEYGACTTGDVVMVDCGYHVLGMPQPDNI